MMCNTEPPKTHLCQWQASHFTLTYEIGRAMVSKRIFRKHAHSSSDFLLIQQNKLDKPHQVVQIGN